MPKSALQKIAFGLAMAMTMVYGMEVYNACLRLGGLAGAAFLIPAGEFAGLTVIVIALQAWVGAPLAKRLAFRCLADLKTKNPRMLPACFSTCMVLVMCPLMSLAATLLFKGIDWNLPAKWLKTFAFNFPMALFWQLAVAGPLVRLLIRKAFRAGLPMPARETAGEAENSEA